MADARGQIVAELTEPTDPRGGAHVAEQIAASAVKLAQHRRDRGHAGASCHGGNSGRDRSAHGPCFPDSKHRRVAGFRCPRLPARPLRAGRAIENDVNLAMLGEQALGCASQCRNAAFLALGTGAGLGLLIDGKLFRGARGSAGEIADLPIWARPDFAGRLDRRAPSSSRWARSPSWIDTAARVEPRPRRYATFSGCCSKATRWRRRSSTRRRAGWLSPSRRCNRSSIWSSSCWAAASACVPSSTSGSGRPFPRLFSRPIAIAPSQLGDRAGLIGAVCAAVQALRQRQEPAQSRRPA